MILEWPPIVSCIMRVVLRVRPGYISLDWHGIQPDKATIWVGTSAQIPLTGDTEKTVPQAGIKRQTPGAADIALRTRRSPNFSVLYRRNRETTPLELYTRLLKLLTIIRSSEAIIEKQAVSSLVLSLVVLKVTLFESFGKCPAVLVEQITSQLLSRRLFFGE